MISIHSSLEEQVRDYKLIQSELAKLQFALGGNWDYDGGSFDRNLDDRRTVWIRIPFEITQGQFDGESSEIEAQIQIGKPYVLKHLYQEGLDDTAEIHTYGALTDQFQRPSKMDAEIEPEWIEKGKIVIKQVEQLLH